MSQSSTMPSSGYNWKKMIENRPQYIEALSDAIQFHQKLHPKMTLGELERAKDRLWDMANALHIRDMYKELSSANKMPKDVGGSFFADTYAYCIGVSDGKGKVRVVYQHSENLFVPGSWVLDMYDLYNEHLEEKEKMKILTLNMEREKLARKMGIIQ